MLPGVLTTGATFVRNFPGPVAIVAMLSLVVGAAGSWFITRSWYVSEVASLRVQLADVKAGNATETARRVAEGAADLIKAEASLRERVDRIAAALEAAAPQIRATVRSLEAAQQELSRDARYACRRDALPDGYLDRLRLPAAGPAP